MGLGIDSFTIRDIRDKHGYLEALGKPRIAEVKRTAAIAEAIATKESMIAQADAERETRERQAEAQKLAQEAEAKRDAAVGEAQADKDRRQAEAQAASRQAAEVANFQAAQAIAEQQREANLKKADADMAYELQKKTIEIRVQEQEILRREKELDATIRRQADAKRYENRDPRRGGPEESGDQASATKTQGLADAHVKQAQGVAQAEAQQSAGYRRSGDRAGAGSRRGRSAESAGSCRSARHGKEGRGLAQVQRGGRPPDPGAHSPRDRPRHRGAALQDSTASRW